MLMEGLHKMCLSVIVHIYTAARLIEHVFNFWIKMYFDCLFWNVFSVHKMKISGWYYYTMIRKKERRKKYI